MEPATQRRYLRNILLSLAVPSLILASICVMPIQCNNAKMASFIRDIEKLNVPQDSYVVSIADDFGTLFYSGNWCTYRVRLLVATSLSEKQFRAFWKAKHVDLPENGEPVVPQVWKLGVPLDENGEAGFGDGPVPDYNAVLYLVTFEGGHEAGLDIRCN
jgi:hypothetical protein